MKRLCLLFLFLPSCGIFQSKCEDANTITFLAAVHEVTQEDTAYIVADSAISEDVARERLIRNEAIEKRIALILGEKARKP